MSLLGFDKSLSKLRQAESKFLKLGIEAARREFGYNFSTESNNESGSAWSAVRRAMPPAILIHTGSLREQAVRTGVVVYTSGRAVLTVDPIDENGKGYAQYHQDGIGRVVERAFITQSASLTNEQEQILLKVTDEIF